MLINRYLTSQKNLQALLKRIQEGTAPDKFTLTHLRGIGFTSSNDNAMIPLLKGLGFLSEDGTPTQRYHDYRDTVRAPYVLGEALREAYADLFHLNEKLSDADREAIKGKFKSTHNATERVAESQAATFLALVPLAKFGDKKLGASAVAPSAQEVAASNDIPSPRVTGVSTTLHYNIQIHLPATKDLDTYNAIFKALREHLLDG